MANSFNASLDSRVYLVPEISGSGYNSSGVPSQNESPLLLDATSEVSITYQTQVTNYYVNSGQDNTDNVQNQPRLISFSGVISDDEGLYSFITSRAGGSETHKATTYQQVIASAVRDKELFSVHIPNVGVITNCVITNCRFSTNKNRYNAFEVSISLKEIRLADEKPDNPDITVVDTLTDEKAGSGGGTEKVETPLVEVPPVEETKSIVSGRAFNVSPNRVSKVTQRSIGNALGALSQLEQLAARQVR